MTIEQAGNFLISSILVGIGFCIITVAILVINNLFHKYWKPVRIFTPDSWRAFNPPDNPALYEVEKTPPTFDKK